MFKVMYVRTRGGNPYLHTYRTNSQRDEFERDEARTIANKIEWQRVRVENTDVAIVPAGQDCPDQCPMCRVNLKADGYPLAHKDGDGDECPITWGRNSESRNSESRSCGRPWVAEIELCPRCGLDASRHVRMTVL